MPSTQAYSVDWTVTIQPEGDVSEDVAEITIIEEEGKPEAATVLLNTSERPHALEEQRDISIELSDGNVTKSFDGFTDSVSDDAEQPTVTVDARQAGGLLRDITAAGSIDGSTLFHVIDGIVDTSAGKVREITFDPDNAASSYGTFAGDSDYGKIDIAHVPRFGVDYDRIQKHETTTRGKEVQLVIDNYGNSTNITYTCDITGLDADGTQVTASFDLPPATSAQDAFGSDTFKLALTGGNQKMVELTGVSTNVPSLNQGLSVQLGGTVQNYVKTSWDFKVDSETTVYEAINRIVSYISGLDGATTWEFFVDSSDELIVRPEPTAIPNRYVFREGDNVLKPVATRSLDGVRNMVKVSGSADVNAWAWAYDGDFYDESALHPFEDDSFPDSGFIWDANPGVTSNHVDDINLRGKALGSPTITSREQALDIAHKALREFIRTPVSGQAPTPGIHEASVGDQAEIYYPSRGIPAKVNNNVYSVKKVEYSVTPESAKTTIDFGMAKRNLGDMFQSGGSIQRQDISDSIRQFEQNVGEDGDGGSDGLLVVGTLDSQNDDGTWEVSGEDGNTYSDVRVI